MTIMIIKSLELALVKKAMVEEEERIFLPLKAD